MAVSSFASSHSLCLLSAFSVPLALGYRLDWFDGSASIEQCIMQQAASAAAAATAESANASEAMEDTAEAVAAAADAVSFSSSAPAVASSGSGVLQLRSGAHTLLVDSSLLHSASQWSTTARAVGADGETSSQISMLQFEPGGWYEVIGEVMRSTPNGVASEVAGAPTVFVRARVCRALDDSFDAQLFEETVLLRRKMLAER